LGRYPPADACAGIAGGCDEHTIRCGFQAMRDIDRCGGGNGASATRLGLESGIVADAVAGSGDDGPRPVAAALGFEAIALRDIAGRPIGKVDATMRAGVITEERVVI